MCKGQAPQSSSRLRVQVASYPVSRLDLDELGGHAAACLDGHRTARGKATLIPGINGSSGLTTGLHAIRQKAFLRVRYRIEQCFRVGMEWCLENGVGLTPFHDL